MADQYGVHTRQGPTSRAEGHEYENLARELMMNVRDIASPATVQGPLDDEFGPYLDEAKRDPAFRAAYEDAEELQRIVDTLVRLRRALGLSQKIVAEITRVRQPTISGFENEGSDPRFSTLQRYARAVQARLRLIVDVPSACEPNIELPPEIPGLTDYSPSPDTENGVESEDHQVIDGDLLEQIVLDACPAWISTTAAQALATAVLVGCVQTGYFQVVRGPAGALWVPDCGSLVSSQPR